MTLNHELVQSMGVNRNEVALGEDSLTIEDIVHFPSRTRTIFHGVVSIKGLIEAAKNVLIYLGKLLFILSVSLTCALSFWYIRAWIPNSVTYSYKNYVIWLDSSIFGVIPSLWVQQNCRIELLDEFLRGVWFSYVFILIFGSAIVFVLRGSTTRHVLSVALTLSAGLLVHYILPTQPPWMAVDGVIRINGAVYTSADKNLVAAMPSIHQAIICFLGCALWRHGNLGRLVAITYNSLMAISLVYLGEHFLVDSVAGVIVAIASWLLAEQILIGCRQAKRRVSTTSLIK